MSSTTGSITGSIFNKPVGGVLDLIGNTPLVAVRGFDLGLCELYVKLESQNPGGSIKDRIGLSMIEAAEKSGALLPGGTIVDATSGSTGIGLAMVGAIKGYKVILVVPDKMSREKILHLRALGAEVVITRSDVSRGHYEYYQDMAQRIARETPGAYYINQFTNPVNSATHEGTTAVEIWEQMEHRLDAVVFGVASGGTLAGCGRFFRRVAPSVEIVVADPKGSIIADYINKGRVGEADTWLVEGVGEGFVPPLFESGLATKAYSVSDTESFEAARTLLKTDGILGGSSSGTLIAAAVRYCKEQTTKKRVVTFICDSGQKYLTRVYNDFWMQDNGYMKSTQFGDLRDYITHRYSKGQVVTVGPQDSLAVALQKMKLYDISQLPVLDGGSVMGVLDESDLLVAISDKRASFEHPVAHYMSTSVKILHPKAKLEELLAVLKTGHVAMIASEERFHGLVTRIDLLTRLRLRSSI